VAVELFIPKKFTKAHEWVIRQANKIIDEYLEQGYTLTLRQVHYQFVARDLYENTQANYKRLGNILDAARKAGLVDWDAIEDRTRILRRIPVWDGPEKALERVRDSFKLDPWDEQPKLRRVEVWVEKDAAVGIVQPTCDKLRIPYFSCRGYSSSSGLYEAGKRLEAYHKAGYETTVLYLGDHDPSGVQMTEVSEERVEMYARHQIDFRRIALTLPQVEEFSPPPNFAKETDSRTKWYVERFDTEECWELDALSPKTVDQIIRAEVEPMIDEKAWAATLEQEEEHRKVLAEIISDWDRTKAAPDMLNKLREFATQYSITGELDDNGDGHEDTMFAQQVIDESGDVLNKHGLL
tara:strand:+ start:1321 stop:2373 length:1053 start_codon:yes stop_codon:yes gene_type:complete